MSDKLTEIVQNMWTTEKIPEEQEQIHLLLNKVIEQM